MITLMLTLLVAGDLVSEPTTPLLATSSGTFSKHLVGGADNASMSNGALLEALAPEVVWPHISWTADHYRVALTALADMHAAWWGRPPDASKYPWMWSPTGYHIHNLVREARSALLEIESASWGAKFLPKERLHSWLCVLDDPSCIFDTIAGMPQTLIHGDYWTGKIGAQGFAPLRAADGPTIFGWRPVVVGPAPYDLACLHSLARWRFGRVPLSLAEMRNHYLARLNERLGQNIDRYVFDLGIDAARAWRFAILWPTIIVEHHATLLATLHRLQNAVIEPAFASLRRCI